MMMQRSVVEAFSTTSNMVATVVKRSVDTAIKTVLN
jgi:hypothetical protein